MVTTYPKCPRCGSIILTTGAPHTENIARQWECRCGYILVEYRHTRGE